MPKPSLATVCAGEFCRNHRVHHGESGSASVARRFYKTLRGKCAKLASLRATVGIARPELAPGIRSFPFRGYVIFFRCRKGFFDVVNVLEGHRDFDVFFTRTRSTVTDPDLE